MAPGELRRASGWAYSTATISFYRRVSPEEPSARRAQRPAGPPADFSPPLRSGNIPEVGVAHVLGLP